MEDKQQKLAIEYTDGPAMILAGPGSGKTKVLTHHVKYLIEDGIPPSQIMVITFTRSAALEMKNRFKELMPTAANKVLFGTFHSIFYKLLKEYKEDIPNIVSDKKRREIYNHIAKSDEEAEWLSNNISFYKALTNKNAFSLETEKAEKLFMDKYKEYEDLLKINSVIDFDDILLLFYSMVREDSDILNKLKSRFRQVCIDEFQDINPIQYESIRLLTGNEGVVYAVGDEDQSIYAFRGANPGIMSQYLNDYKNVKLIELVRNYRSYDDITRAAEKVINEASSRLKKEVTQNIKVDTNRHFYLSVLSNRTEMMNLFVRDVTSLSDKEKTLAVLLRTNKDVNEYMQILNLNVTGNEIENAAYGAVKDYLNYILSKDLDSFRKVLNIPIRNLPLSILDAYGGDIDKLIKQFSGSYKGNQLNTLKKHITVLAKLHPYSFVMYLRNVVGIEKYIMDISGNNLRVKAAFDELLKASTSITDLNELFLYISSHLEKKHNNVNSNIVVSTFHRSKGLEYDYVFIPNVIEGKIPGPNAVLGLTVEEERRLLYVAMTRAKEKLFLYTIKNEESFGALPSRFINVLL